MASITPETQSASPGEATPANVFAEDWRDQLRTALRSADDLVSVGLIPEDQKDAYQEVLGRYRFVLPRYYAGLIDRSDPACPIRAQAVPRLDELDGDAQLVPDPLRDLGHRPTERITHRYRDRVLLHLTPSCSMYCRFCFRKSLLNDLSDELFVGSVERAVEYVRTHSEIREVIFSGGDPLLSAEATLHKTLASLSVIDHLRRVRFHSRVPVTLPMRITESYAASLLVPGKQTTLITHFNHPRELTEEAAAACARLRAAGITVLNQSVLLRGVNDSVEVLEELSEGLWAIGVMPYYLHHPDPAQGTAHFQLSEARGLEIYRELRERLSGYLVPRYVIDRVELPYKSLVIETLTSRSS